MQVSRGYVISYSAGLLEDKLCWNKNSTYSFFFIQTIPISTYFNTFKEATLYQNPLPDHLADCNCDKQDFTKNVCEFIQLGTYQHVVAGHHQHAVAGCHQHAVARPHQHVLTGRHQHVVTGRHQHVVAGYHQHGWLGIISMW